MAQLVTRKTESSVEGFLEGIENETRRSDCRAVVELMREVVGEPPKMWGSSIIGFGDYHYRYESGREGDWFLAGVSPRKQNLTLYIMPGFSEYEALLTKLGKHKTGKSCLYLKRLSDVDPRVLEELIGSSVRHMKTKYG
jgi:hypothetical protein